MQVTVVSNSMCNLPRHPHILLDDQKWTGHKEDMIQRHGAGGPCLEYDPPTSNGFFLLLPQDACW